MTATRRAFCRLAGASLLLSNAAGCASTRSAIATASSTPLGTVTWQLGWFKNVAYAGSYIADTRGYYRAQGIQVVILAGGPNVAVVPLVVAGKALIGDSTVAQVAQGRASGAPVKVVAAWERDPFEFISLAATPIRTPRELIGKRLGVPSSNLIDAKGFLKANGISPDAVQFVPVEYDPAPLVAGEIDAYFGFSTNEATTLQVRGVRIHALRVADFGYSGLFRVYAVHEKSLADPVARAKVKAFLRGERRGWRDQLRDPNLGVELTVRTYGSNIGLNWKQQTLQSRAVNDLLATPDTRDHGLFWMSPAKMNRTVAILRQEGIAASTSDLFDTTLLAEIDANAEAVRERRSG